MMSTMHPDAPESYLPAEYEDLTALRNHLQEIADGYLERQYDDIVHESMLETINTIQDVLDRMEQGD